MQKKTMLIQTEISEGRTVSACFLQVIYDDDGYEIARSGRPHVVSFAPDADPDALLVVINSDITTRDGMKWNPIEPTEWDRVVAHCEIEHTPEVKQAYEIFKAAQIQSMTTPIQSEKGKP